MSLYPEDLLLKLSHTTLFSGLAPGDISALLECLGARRVRYAKDALIITEGELVTEFGVMLSGRGRSIIWDASDKLFTITHLSEGSEIGAMLAASPGHESPVSVQTTEDCEVLLIPYDRLVARCKSACPRHEALLRNYIAIVAEKGLFLHERMSCLVKPSVRDKIMTYLQRVSRERQSRTFDIPLDRKAMSEYLNVERSALSRELSSMKRDGLIDYHRSSFKLL
jgi:CRP-like cAMP-binding protein